MPSTPEPTRRRRTIRRVAILFAAVAALALLDPRPVVAFRDFSCPSGYRERGVGLTNTAITCEPNTADGPPLPPEQRYGSRQREVGLYLARVNVRVFDVDLLGDDPHWIGWNVPAPP